MTEDVAYSHGQLNTRRAQARRAVGLASHQIHVGSRTFAGGALLTAGLGVLASIPLVARVLFPRLTAQIRETFGRFVQPPPLTQLELERSDSAPRPEPGHVGYSLDEMASMAERLLRDIGLTSGFAPAVHHPGARLEQPEQSAQVGLRLRRLRRRLRRAERPGLGPDAQRSARPRAARGARPGGSDGRRSSSAAATTPATTR